MVFVNFEVGKIRALVYTLFLSYRLNDESVELFLVEGVMNE